MRNTLLFVAVFLVSITASAQMLKIGGREFGYVYVGPKAGIAFSKLSNADGFGGNGDTKFRTGFQFGVVGKFGITDRWAIQPEIVFMQKGVKVETGPIESKFKTSYVNVPILAKYSLLALGFTKIHATGGVYSSIRTGGEVEFKDPGGTFTQDLDNSGWRRMDYGMAIGAGAEFRNKYGLWVVDVRYDYSFTDMHKTDNVRNSNRTIGVSVTYLYDFVDLYYRIKNKKKPESPATPATPATQPANQ